MQFKTGKVLEGNIKMKQKLKDTAIRNVTLFSLVHIFNVSKNLLSPISG
jgi:hypothetical protein